MRLCFLTVLAAVPAAVGQGSIEMYLPVQTDGACASCLCVDCPCALRTCGKCAQALLVARIVVEQTDGVCRQTRLEAKHPAASVKQMSPLRYVAALCGNGVWIGADGPTQERCEERAAGIAEAFSRGEFDGRTSQCLPSAGGAWMRYSCDSEKRTSAEAALPTVMTERSQTEGDPGLLELLPPAARARLQYGGGSAADAVPLLVPLALCLYLLRRMLCGCCHSSSSNRDRH
eukprot:TRINITY_DN2130_c0_g1_i1.p1 TRINITY_DN2130_c0_g1~~TRINITY_DN2130_c0_g1_i1.p1  ORF type:complete len:231 (+),score=37.66 TRINITY_DN2130_c0_g1_i1:102-794(+)